MTRERRSRRCSTSPLVPAGRRDGRGRGAGRGGRGAGGGGGGGRSAAALAAAFQETIVAVTGELLEAARQETGIRTVCLSGGVFQNRRLANRLLRQLGRAGFEPLVNRLVPVNDGGVSYGQAAVAAARLEG
jgi:hydrogenase maturation protein HypF